MRRSAFLRKSFSIVNRPIFVWSRAGSSSAAGAVAAPANTAAASVADFRFHSRTCAGCTSNRRANSVTVPSPRSAANATLALNAGAWFLRGVSA